MFVIDQIGLPQLGLTGLEADLSEEERAIQESAHRFAEEVMRPIAEKLDKMTPEEVVAQGSPLWEYLQQIKDSGLLDLEMIASMGNAEKSRIIPIIFEELAWGDSGLTLLAMVTSFPAFSAHATGDPELIERFGDKIGCWLGTWSRRCPPSWTTSAADTTALRPKAGRVSRPSLRPNFGSPRRFSCPSPQREPDNEATHPRRLAALVQKEPRRRDLAVNEG